MAKKASAVNTQTGRTVVRRNVLSLSGSLVVYPFLAGLAASAWRGVPAAVVAAVAVFAVLVVLLWTDRITLANGELRKSRFMGLRSRRIPASELTVDGRHRSLAGSSIVFSSASQSFEIPLFRTRKNAEWYPREQVKSLVLAVDLAGALVKPSAWETLGLAMPSSEPVTLGSGKVRVRLDPTFTATCLLFLGLVPGVFLVDGVKSGNSAAVAALTIGVFLLGFVALRLFLFHYVETDGSVLRSVKFSGSSHTFVASAVRVRLRRWLWFRRIEFSSGGDKFSLALARMKSGDAWSRRKLKGLIARIAASGAEVDQDVLDFLEDA